MINLRSVSTITVTAVPVDMMFTRSVPLVKEINVEMVELIMDYFHEYPYIEV